MHISHLLNQGLLNIYRPGSFTLYMFTSACCTSPVASEHPPCVQGFTPNRETCRKKQHQTIGRLAALRLDHQILNPQKQLYRSRLLIPLEAWRRTLYMAGETKESLKRRQYHVIRDPKRGLYSEGHYNERSHVQRKIFWQNKAPEYYFRFRLDSVWGQDYTSKEFLLSLFW